MKLFIIYAVKEDAKHGKKSNGTPNGVTTRSRSRQSE